MIMTMAIGGLGIAASSAEAAPRQDSADDQGDPDQLVLVSQTSFVEPDGVFVMEVDLGRLQPANAADPGDADETDADETDAGTQTDGDASVVEVVVTVYGRIVEA